MIHGTRPHDWKTNALESMKTPSICLTVCARYPTRTNPPWPTNMNAKPMHRIRPSSRRSPQRWGKGARESTSSMWPS